VYPPFVMMVRSSTIDIFWTCASTSSRGITPGTGDRERERGVGDAARRGALVG